MNLAKNLHWGLQVIAVGALMVASPEAATSAEEAPVAQWEFGTEEATPLVPHGGVHRDQPGPRPPEYPDFSELNTAVRLDGQGAHFSYEDPGNESDFDFTNGDEITLEAWVQMDNIHPGENLYVIGKGRTGRPGFQRDNQNWALRIRGIGGRGCISFLFSTPRKPGQKGEENWHRWTSVSGFPAGKNWHHIAISYRFGDPSSIHGWIDGKRREGVWDVGGPTSEPPVVDNDAVWIGSALGGSPSNSFRGGLDSIRIHRRILDDATMASRFRRVGESDVIEPAKEVAPSIDGIRPGSVLITLHEGMPAHDRWLNSNEEVPPETMRWYSDDFLLDRLPHRYDSWGIRDSWKSPVLLRMSADAVLPPGKHRVLLRARGLSRLWINDKVVARTKKLVGAPHGEEPVIPVAKPPLPGMRSAEHHQQESFGEFTVDVDGRCRVILETLVGGQRFRADPGESCVAVETEDGQAYQLMPTTESRRVLLTDEEILAALEQQEQFLQSFDDQHRRTAASSRDAFWNRRHELARKWVKDHPPAVQPEEGTHPIDYFIDRKIEEALAASAEVSPEEASQFHDKLLPILQNNCFRCHGEKVKGGLVLTSRESAIAGGDSGLPGIDVEDPAESELLRRIKSDDPSEWMPPGGERLSAEEIATLEQWIENGAVWPAPPVTEESVAKSRELSDSEFLRKVFLDTVGVPPSEEEIRQFLADGDADKRVRIVDRLLADDRWADQWMGYWLDILAENPTLINASLNTTGPFRWFVYESLRDGKPLDRMVTELIQMRGSAHEGGSAGFAIAANNDAPFAAKGQIIASAFLGIELQCARCHDSPYHSTKQSDLYSLAAMLQRKALTVPSTSRVPKAFFEKQERASLIEVSLKPDEPVAPIWPFAEVTGCADDEALDELMEQPKDLRERLAALVTAPANERFAEVMVNRVWRRYIGAGIVEPPDDWEGNAPSHPDLLEWLARDFVEHGYDLKHLSRRILTSSLYQRSATGWNREATPEQRFFAAPDLRRMTAEQIVDSLCYAGGHSLNVEELTFDPDGRWPSRMRLTLGVPKRAWMFASLANERDRPSLSLPRARNVTDMLEAFGWNGSRQNPRTDRETAANVLQPGVMANSTESVLMTRASLGTGLAELAVKANSPQQLVDSIFLRYLGRFPTEEEKQPFVAALAEGFDSRILPDDEVQMPEPVEPLPMVTWANHITPEANSIALEREERARQGLPPDPRLRKDWREVYEDAVWSVVNLSEFIWLP